ncbi:MAG: DUF6263 family protein [Planctomycetota bacterium]
MARTMQRSRLFPCVPALAVAFATIGSLTPATALAQGMGEAAAAPAGIKTTLLDAGEGPRSTLRVDLEPGATQKFEMRMLTKTAMSMRGQQMPAMDLPTVVMPMVVKVGDARDDDSWNVAMSFSEPRFEGGNPQMAAMMRQALAGFDTLEATGVVSDQAQWESITLKAADKLSPELREQAEMMESSVQQMGAILPNEAVGIGARWRVTQQMNTSGMNMTNSVVYTLESREGDTIKLAAELEQTVPAQVVAPPNAGGMQFQTVGTGKGQGTFVLDLSSLMATEATLTSDTDMSMETEGPNGAMKMEMDIATTMSIKTVE